MGWKRALRRAALQVKRLPWVDIDDKPIQKEVLQPERFEIAATAVNDAVAAVKEEVLAPKTPAKRAAAPRTPAKRAAAPKKKEKSW